MEDLDLKNGICALVSLFSFPKEQNHVVDGDQAMHHILITLCLFLSIYARGKGE